MIDVIDRHRSQIAQLCTLYGVRKLELFGSAAGGSYDPATSDLDFVVDFADRSPGYARRYLAFAEALEALLEHKVDLVTERSVKNPYFRASVNATRQIVYAAEDRQTAA